MEGTWHNEVAGYAFSGADLTRDAKQITELSTAVSRNASDLAVIGSTSDPDAVRMSGIDPLVYIGARPSCETPRPSALSLLF